MHQTTAASAGRDPDRAQSRARAAVRAFAEQLRSSADARRAALRAERDAAMAAITDPNSRKALRQVHAERRRRLDQQIEQRQLSRKLLAAARERGAGVTPQRESGDDHDRP
ncbi:hypothetical protein ABZ807_19370 [Micromonospora sp. NPDC047548]|uniref:hypothetical protein n=1 Tax=Micromonospora sp. NPDC047548 TaxID=3155624 RepID=UPI0033F0421B